MVTNLKEQFGRKYVVRDDGTGDSSPKEKVWGWQIPCKYGVIYPHGWDGTLAVCLHSKRVARRIKAKLGLVVRLNGSFETVFLFPPALLDAVATLAKACKRKTITPELRAQLIKRLSQAKNGSACHNSKADNTPQERGSHAQERL